MRLVLLLGLAAAVACGGSEEEPSSTLNSGTLAGDASTRDAHTSIDDAGGGSDAPGLPACVALASYPGQDDASSGCSAARAYVRCPNEVCLSNDPQGCPGTGTVYVNGMPVPQTQCSDQCMPDEYAVACGANSSGNPPSSCRFVVASTGPTFFCCPCGG
jgi:hypothetical protein